jgi:beta-N-acetylhexosaminidase
VASAVGHFPGEGSASSYPGSDAATVGLTIAELRQADMLPFARVARTAAAVMMSNAVYAGFDGVTPATQLPEAVKLLRDLGFRGVVVSGDLTAGGGSVGKAAVEALRAGCDLLYVPGAAGPQESAYRAVAAAIRRGDVPAARAAEALKHVVALQRLH